MTTQTFVAVYAVGDDGATGPRLGAATLVDPEYALVDRPLNEQLASGTHALRVGVSAAGVTEVIDVARVRVLPDAPELVLLQLLSASAAPPHELPVTPPDGGAPTPEPTRAEIVDALRAVLAEPPPPAPAESSVSFVNDPIRWLLHVFGND